MSCTVSPCRACLVQQDELCSLWQEVNVLGRAKVLKDLLVECASIEIEKDDSLPFEICKSCTERLVQYCEFRTMCRESDTKLRCTLDDHNYYFKSGDGICDVDTDIATEESEISETEGLPVQSHSEPNVDLDFEVTDGIVEGPRVCPICKRNFHSQDTFNKHVNTHVDSSDLTCKVCGKEFTRSFDVRRHMTLHTGLKPYSCNVCLASFTQSGTLAQHKRKHEEYEDMPKPNEKAVEKPHLCSTCGTTFKDSSSLNVHIRRHNGDKPYECKSCGMSIDCSVASCSCSTCDDVSSAPHAIPDAAEESPAIEVSKTGPSNSTICVKCSVTFSKTSELHMHAIKEHPVSTTKSSVPPPTKCDICKINFSRAAYFKKHLERKHPEKLSVMFPKKKYAAMAICNECDQTFVNKSNLSKHIKNKHSDSIAFIKCENGENKYQCRRCDNAYSNKQELIEHASTHYAIKSTKLFKCPLCPHESCKQKNAIKHLQETHNIILETETLVFASFEEFETWKKNKEQKTSSFYVSGHGSYKTNKFVKFKYFCHRSGVVRRQGKGIRRIKRSKKIDGFCPSKLEVIVKADKCEVVFIKTHVGHMHDNEEK